MDAIVGYMVAIALSMLTMAQYFQWQTTGMTNVQTAAAASQQFVVNKKAEQYVQDNGAAIAAQATATTPVTITAAMLVNAGYLPSGFSQTNAFRQTWQVQVLQPLAGQLQAVVETIGGRAITDTLQLVQIAAQTGAQGGFVPYAGQNGDPSMNPNNAYGAFGSWSIPLAGTGFTNPGSGHLVSLLAFTGVQSNNGFLYRVKVPNHPELNNMQTDLGLTDTAGKKHDINGAATVTGDTLQTSGGGQLNSDQGGSLELGGNNGTAGSGNPYIDFHLGGQGTQDFNVRLINDGNGHLTLSSANGRSSLTVGSIQLGNLGSPGQSCTNGTMTGNADGTGQLLVCHFGKYEPSSGPWMLYQTYPVSYGSSVPAPVCSAGAAAKIVLATQNFYVDNTAVVNWVTQGGGPWTVYSFDGVNQPVSAVGIASTYCAYN